MNKSEEGKSLTEQFDDELSAFLDDPRWREMRTIETIGLLERQNFILKARFSGYRQVPIEK